MGKSYQPIFGIIFSFTILLNLNEYLCEIIKKVRYMAKIPNKSSPRRTNKKTKTRKLSSQQKVGLTSGKPMPEEQKTSIRNKLKKNKVQTPAVETPNALLIENGEYLLTETGEFLGWN